MYDIGFTLMYYGIPYITYCNILWYTVSVLSILKSNFLQYRFFLLRACSPFWKKLCIVKNLISKWTIQTHYIIVQLKYAVENLQHNTVRYIIKKLSMNYKVQYYTVKYFIKLFLYCPFWNQIFYSTAFFYYKGPQALSEKNSVL